MEKAKCRFCKICNGKGCVGQMPGMGGPFDSRNFILNYEGWEKIRGLDEISDSNPDVKIRLAPMTGGVENVGYFDERQFYLDLISSCVKSGVRLSIGDGCPDEKLEWGVEAVKVARSVNPDLKAAVFIKPYPQDSIFGRFERAMDIAESFGIDIDSSRIATMRDKVHLELKTSEQLKEIKKYLNSKGFPFIIKGVFTTDDLELVEEVKPDVAFVSNHGGRVETRIGSTAEFLADHSSFLSENSGEIWVDGGIRNGSHVRTAARLGASEVLVGRPFASSICMDRENGASRVMKILSESVSL